MTARDPHTSPVALTINARLRDLGGGFTVRRVLPFAERRMVGPFVFFDHVGPVAFAPGQGLDVRPHPHIHLATVTYLFEGEIDHRDSLGFHQTIRPGDINWMTAGRGIVHSERTGPVARQAGGQLHGIQCWVALPQSKEKSDPNFVHHPAGTLPQVTVPGGYVRILAGSAYGVTAPVATASPLFYGECRLEAGASLAIPRAGERAIYVVTGTITADGAAYEGGTMVIATDNAPFTLTASTACHVMILGGAPLDGPRHVWWNFVSSSPERIEDAKQVWKEGRFPVVPGDESEFIPLPE